MTTCIFLISFSTWKWFYCFSRRRSFKFCFAILYWWFYIVVDRLIVDFCWQKRCLSNGKWPCFTFKSQGNIYSLIMLFFDAARSESNFQMSEIKHAAEASTFHLETRVAILSNSSLLTQLLCCAETNNKTWTMERQWANSYILIIFDAGAFLMRVLQTQTRVRNFLVLVSNAFFGTHISGLHCN